LKKKRILFFTKYTRKGASSRLRTYQYFDYWQQQGVHCQASPLFSDVYLEQVYKSKTHNKWMAFKGFVNRLVILFTVGKYDLIVIEKELFPYFPAWPERILALFGIKYVVDYDDAIWHNYDVTNNPVIRLLFKRKIDVVMKRAALVVAGNLYIAEKARAVNAKAVTIIPTAVDIKKYVAKENFSSDLLTVGWIGSPITSKYLWDLLPIFRPLLLEKKIRLLLIGADPKLGNEPLVEVVPWDEASEAEIIRIFDVGIMPLVDTIWERGKCGYKLIQYMACGLPVIGTPIGVNAKIIKPGINGWHASSLSEWTSALTDCIDNFDKLKEKGLHGRNLVQSEFAMQRYQSEWLDIFFKLTNPNA
jgi:glycosyltransferase involved in cell wall biosynthesis